MQFIHEENQVSSELNYQANHLRIVCNKAAHDDMESGFDTAFSSGVLVISELLQLFGELNQTEPISAFLFKQNVKAFQRMPDSPKESFTACLQDWTVRDNEIELRVSSEQGELVTIYLKDDLKSKSEGRRWTYLDKMIWPYSTISFFELTKDKNTSLVYYSNPLTQVILEPDFLLDATSVAECIQDEHCQPQFFVMNKLVTEPVTEKIMLGNLVNQLFDHLVFNPDSEFEDFASTLRQHQPIAFCSLGEDSVQRITETIRTQHYPQLKAFTESLVERDLQVEPSFICPKYGLQGRLDLLYGDQDKLAIVELKSGKAPARNTWRGQQMQVTAYNMIIRSIFGDKVQSSSSILYSADTEQPLRNVENHILREQELLFCRNRVIGILHQLALDPFPFFRWLRDSRLEYKNPIFKDKARQVQESLRAITDIEFEWFLQQVKAVVGEIWTVKTGSPDPENPRGKGYNSLWQDDPVTKLESYQIITGLKIVSQEQSNLTLSLPEETSSDFREGDVVILYNMNRPVEKQQLLRGSLCEINDKELRLTIRGGIKGVKLFTSSDSWAIEHDILDSLLYVPLSSLYTFINAPKDRRECLLGIRPPRGTTGHYGEDQEAICSQILDAQDYCVIQGPPGTGKTSGLLMKYIRRVYEGSKSRLLILSYTNRAVDEICKNLEEQELPFIRTGFSQSIKESLLSAVVMDKSPQEVETLLVETRIWLATIQSAGSWLKDALTFMGFDELIIDEASQIIEPSILGFMTKVKKTILIGDQNQLPPIVLQNRHRYHFESSELKELAYSGLSRSLLERLFILAENRGWTHAYNTLSIHYRMHDQIATLLARYYNHKLKSGGGRQSQSLPSELDKHPILSHRLVWMDIPLSESSKTDPRITTAVLKLITILDEAGELSSLEKDLGIIAPFRAMIQALKNYLPPRYSAVSVDTVERYQGSQRRNIILTLPLRSAHELRMMESLSDDARVDRKLNVAISRASERMIVLGNSEICSVSLHYRDLLQGFKASGIHLSYDKVKELLGE